VERLCPLRRHRAERQLSHIVVRLLGVREQPASGCETATCMTRPFCLKSFLHDFCPSLRAALNFAISSMSVMTTEEKSEPGAKESTSRPAEWLLHISNASARVKATSGQPSNLLHACITADADGIPTGDAILQNAKIR